MDMITFSSQSCLLWDQILHSNSLSAFGTKNLSCLLSSSALQSVPSILLKWITSVICFWKFVACLKNSIRILQIFEKSMLPACLHEETAILVVEIRHWLSRHSVFISKSWPEYCSTRLMHESSFAEWRTT